MKKLEFKINIDAGPKKVWDIMLNPITYKEWVNVSWPNSHYEGEWKEGENIRFVSKSGAGTLANLIECVPHKYIMARHTAVINADGTEDRDSETAKGWIGTTESYAFTGNGNSTELKTEIQTNPDWEKMFNEGWPNAMVKLKELCER